MTKTTGTKKATGKVAAKPVAKGGLATAAKSNTKPKPAAKDAARPKLKPAAKRGAKVVVAPVPFTGFPKDFLAFFRELARNNDRVWFEKNKERYLASVVQPSLSFIAALDLPLGRFADCFEAKAKTQGGSMFRIYNDMRFGHDPKPYKENAAFQFRHQAGKDAHAPGFYVHIEPKEVFFGGGIWRPPSPQLRQIREAIEADPERWTSITRAPAFRKRFGEVRGDSLKRPPQGFDADHPLIEEIKRVSFFAMQEATPASIESKNFVTDVAKAFQAMAPFMEFLTDAEGLPFHLDD